MRSKSKHEASPNMKQVQTRTRSITKVLKRRTKASGIMRRAQVQKCDASKWKNETKQVNQGQPKDKRSRRPLKSRDVDCRKTRWSTKRRTKGDHEMSTKVHKSRKPTGRQSIETHRDVD